MAYKKRGWPLKTPRKSRRDTERQEGNSSGSGARRSAYSPYTPSK